MTTAPQPTGEPAAATLTNWAGNLAFGAARLHRPRTLDELRRLVADAPGRVRALGCGHSFSTVADTDGDLVRLDALGADPDAITVDEDARTATVPAGMRYAEAAAALDARGWALHNLASLTHITVAGAVATGTHGSGSGVPSLAAAVVGLELLTADGALRTLTREADPEVFPGAVVSLGALGIATRITLRIEPAYRVAQWVYTDVALDAVAADFAAAFELADSVSVFTRWDDGRAKLWLKQRLGAGASGPASSLLGGSLATENVHPIPGTPAERIADTTPQCGVPGPWHRRLPHFLPEGTPSVGAEIQSEWLLPREEAVRGMAALRALGDRIAAVAQVSEIRTVAADDLWLSGAYGRDTVAFHFTWVRDEAAILPVVGAIDEALAPLGARPHWGKVSTLAGRQVREAYPRFADFAALREELDPSGTFRNAYLDALLG
ncbi:FAD-binding protein [Mangrovactinospora gilvigrisea]|uniref:FAD-binding protein n=1 Tax=Mangrovactinospora gilvigrisea TaxID=1428644 RepID=A0A1J7CF19_9ACTN|nr:D-arabinono-1,4-lactone oxidase [Mangrovactinospora gilvigrisea]OIV38298.1 FAD-binding protein [Mangrovactinospora gilvigrisea]